MVDWLHQFTDLKAFQRKQMVIFSPRVRGLFVEAESTEEDRNSVMQKMFNVAKKPMAPNDFSSKRN